MARFLQNACLFLRPEQNSLSLNKAELTGEENKLVSPKSIMSKQSELHQVKNAISAFGLLGSDVHSQ